MKRIAVAVIIVTMMCNSGVYAASKAGSVTNNSAILKNNFKDVTTGMELIFVKGGCFQMGDIFNLGGEDAKPVHTVCVNDFSIGKHEVTQEQWKRVMGKNPSVFSKCGAKCPVENISWNDAQEFIKELNKKSKVKFRLPTEAEWEYAARSGGKQEEFAGGMILDEVAWHKGNSAGSTHPVGAKKPNGLGLYDMTGNVEEWCNDWYGENYYSESPEQSPKGPATGTQRVMRGGRWSGKNVGAGLRTIRRSFDLPDSHEENYGLRLVLQPK